MNTFVKPAAHIAHLALSPGMKVADLGAGSGFYTLKAAQLVGERGKVYAVDVQEPLLSRIQSEAREQGLEGVITVLHKDIEKKRGTELPENSVDAVIVSNVLFQVEDKEEFVREAGRILKAGKNGLVIGWSDSHKGLGPRIRDVVKESEARKIFEDAGFEIMRDVNAGAHHWGFVVKKKK